MSTHIVFANESTLTIFTSPTLSRLNSLIDHKRCTVGPSSHLLDVISKYYYELLCFPPKVNSVSGGGTLSHQLSAIQISLLHCFGNPRQTERGCDLDRFLWRDLVPHTHKDWLARPCYTGEDLSPMTQQGASQQRKSCIDVTTQYKCVSPGAGPTLHWCSWQRRQYDANTRHP
jgi:hypothetical protein